MISTQAWLLHRRGSDEPAQRGELRLETIRFAPPGDREVLVEPLLGCWEGNMTHALQRKPIDVCQQRGEPRVVLGNAGVVRVVEPGPAVSGFREGDLCLVFCNGTPESPGYPGKIFAYDAPNTVGVLARQTKLHERQLIRIPENSRLSLAQWAAFSLRYITAWANWKVAYGCWQVLARGLDLKGPFVWGWGGGVSYAEVTLAQHFGCKAAMIASSEPRLEQIRAAGVLPVSRKPFRDLAFDEGRYRADPAYKKAYQAAEEHFLHLVRDLTGGQGVSILIDYIGGPVHRASIKALGCPGVLTTAGWKEGMNLSVVRALECMGHHTHVHTHYARYSDAVEAVEFAERNGWVPPAEEEIHPWESIPDLARAVEDGRVDSYFPLFSIHPA